MVVAASAVRLPTDVSVCLQGLGLMEALDLDRLHSKLLWHVLLGAQEDQAVVVCCARVCLRRSLS